MGRAAAYLARRHFGYPLTAMIAGALGYRGHNGVGSAVARVEAGREGLQRTIAALGRRLAYWLTSA